jgi:hypothetical protein
MSDISIPEVSMTPKVTQSSYTVERVHKNHRGEYVSNWTNYVTTVYDHRGRLITTHSNHSTNFIV